MISEVVPRGKEFLFFALFSIIGVSFLSCRPNRRPAPLLAHTLQKTSSFIGPFVSSAIIDRSGNNNMPFTFLLGLGAVAMCILWAVDVDKSRVECRKYLEDEAVRVYKLGSVSQTSGESMRSASFHSVRNESPVLPAGQEKL
jgi:hypothetical protein